MGTAPQTLIDLAFTLFLSDPDSYEGGELEIEEPAGTRSFKLPAGAAILYPANSVHEVAKVTSGRRDVAVGWIQSLVRDAEIGRASWRERVCQYVWISVVAVSIKKKTKKKTE